MLHCVAVCCGVLQCIVMVYQVLRCVVNIEEQRGKDAAVVWQCVAVVLQLVLQFVAVCCTVMRKQTS